MTREREKIRKETKKKKHIPILIQVSNLNVTNALKNTLFQSYYV